MKGEGPIAELIAKRVSPSPVAASASTAPLRPWTSAGSPPPPTVGDQMELFGGEG